MSMIIVTFFPFVNPMRGVILHKLRPHLLSNPTVPSVSAPNLFTCFKSWMDLVDPRIVEISYRSLPDHEAAVLAVDDAALRHGK